MHVDKDTIDHARLDRRHVNNSPRDRFNRIGNNSWLTIYCRPHVCGDINPYKADIVIVATGIEQWANLIMFPFAQ